MSSTKPSFEGITAFTIAGQELSADFAEDLRIDRSALQEEFLNQPSLMGKYGFYYAWAEQQELARKVELERVAALVDARARNTSTSKITEKMVSNMVITSQEYQAKEAEYMEAKKTTALLKSMKDALIHRRDMLVQLGSAARAEMNANISINNK